MRIPSMGWMMIRCNSEPQFDHAWLVQKLECPVVALILHGSVQWRGTAQRITIPKNCNVDWENDDKTGYGVQYFRHIDFLYQKSVQRIWTRLGTLWPAGDILTSQAWEILKMDWYSSKIKHGKGRSPQKRRLLMMGNLFGKWYYWILSIWAPDSCRNPILHKGFQFLFFSGKGLWKRHIFGRGSNMVQTVSGKNCIAATQWVDITGICKKDHQIPYMINISWYIYIYIMIIPFGSFPVF